MTVLFFYLREVAGWLLVVVGLLLIGTCLSFLSNEQPPQVIEGSIAAVAGVFVFRGGIHLIKVATAARVVLAVRKTETAARRGA